MVHHGLIITGWWFEYLVGYHYARNHPMVATRYPWIYQMVYWLVVWNMNFIFHFRWMDNPPTIDELIFFKMFFLFHQPVIWLGICGEKHRHHPSSSFIILHHPSSSFIILHHPSSSNMIRVSCFKDDIFRILLEIWANDIILPKTDIQYDPEGLVGPTEG